MASLDYRDLAYMEEIRQKLLRFYKVMDSTKLEDPEHVIYIVELAIKVGLNKLNGRLMNKYGRDLNSPVNSLAAPMRGQQQQEQQRRPPSRMPPPQTQQPPSSFQQGNMPQLPPPPPQFGRTSVAPAYQKGPPQQQQVMSPQQQVMPPQIPSAPQSAMVGAPPQSWGMRTTSALRKSLSSFTRKKSAVEEQIMINAEQDSEYGDYLKTLIEVFYARHDPSRTPDEGLIPVVDFALSQGEEALNIKLRKKYNADLSSVDKSFQEVKYKLQEFYKRLDPTKLEREKAKDLNTIVGWALVHGVDKLNATLVKKYDDDIDGNGLKYKLKLFYQANDKQPKSDYDLNDIVAWTNKNSLEELNKKLLKKYGKTLPVLR